MQNDDTYRHNIAVERDNPPNGDESTLGIVVLLLFVINLIIYISPGVWCHFISFFGLRNVVNSAVISDMSCHRQSWCMESCAYPHVGMFLISLSLSSLQKSVKAGLWPIINTSGIESSTPLNHLNKLLLLNVYNSSSVCHIASISVIRLVMRSIVDCALTAGLQNTLSKQQPASTMCCAINWQLLIPSSLSGLSISAREPSSQLDLACLIRCIFFIDDGTIVCWFSNINQSRTDPSKRSKPDIDF